MKTFDEIFIKKKPLGKASAKETFRKSLIKAQSAMEYLMTYGWAILVIAVALGALFQLGVFNANTFAPKAQPGSCQVVSPSGFPTLEGVCNNELPEFVARINGGWIYVGNSNNMNLNYTVTVTAWVYYLTNTSGNIFEWGGCNRQYQLTTAGGDLIWGVNSLTSGYQQASAGIPTGKWFFVVGLYVPGWACISINGYVWKNCAYPVNAPLVSNPWSGAGIGSFCSGFDGYIANVQLYNTGLSYNQIQALYKEGIGGDPIDLQNLVGWWPLNGNANDYSGNGNTQEMGGYVTFVSNWGSGYTAP